MSLDYDNALEKFYKILKNNLIRHKKKLNSNSVLITLLKLTSNVRFRILEESKVSSGKISNIILKVLIENRFIRVSDTEIGKYYISPQGIWQIEEKQCIISNETLLAFLSNDWFKEIRKPISDKEKIILLSLLSTRTFSINSSADLKKDDRSLECWKEIIESSFDFLKRNKIINSLKPDLYRKKGTKGNEHDVSHFFRHSDKLPKKTMGHFIAPGRQKYYLEITENGEVSLEKLSYIYKLVFTDKLSFDFIIEIKEFCCNIAHEKSLFIFDLDEHIFSHPKYDDVIYDALKNILLNN